MKKVIVTFQVVSFDDEVGNNDSHSRQFEFRGTHEEAVKFLDQVMTKRIEVQEKEAQEAAPL